jgi:type II secretion system protein H
VIAGVESTRDSELGTRNVDPQVRAPRSTFRVGFRGFTLIELIAVMLLVAIMAAIVSPSLSAFSAGRRLNDTAVSMMAMLDMARAYAASEGRPYRFNLDLEKRRYWLTAQDASAFVELGTDLGQYIELPEDVTVTWEAPEGQAQVGYLQITPLGEIDPAAIKLVSRDNVEIYLFSNAVSDKFRIANKDDYQNAASTSTYVDATKPTSTNGASHSSSKSSGKKGGL